MKPEPYSCLLIGLLLTGAVVSAPAPTHAQALMLSELASGETQIEAAIGDTLNIAIVAQLGRLPAAGFSLYITVPESPFEMIDQDPGDDGELAPFRPGPLFAGAVEVTNCLLSREYKVGVPADRRLLHYTAVLGPGSQRSRSGEGVVAVFSVLCRELVGLSNIAIHSSPIHETRMVMNDGAERLFHHGDGISVTVDVDTSVYSITWGLVKQSARTLE